MSPTSPRLTSHFADALPELSAPWSPVPFSDASLLLLNEPLATDMGFDVTWLRSDEGLRFLLGQPQTTDTLQWPHPVAQAYSGHQFGSFSPVLGDGRAVLLGEVELQQADGTSRFVDVHLKGSGRTPFSRGGADGRACLGPMLREYLVSEAMHAMGIPTTRALAVVLTGETVLRQRPERGALLVRVARSHLRVGSFQCARMLREKQPQVLDNLVKFAVERHPIALHEGANRTEFGASRMAANSASQPDESSPTALQLLDAVARRHARLIAQWMRVGFVHGVMNSDNMTVSGETIDYGPCAFLDAFDTAACFSSIDVQGRYAFGRQPQIAMWNLQRFAEALLPLIASDSSGVDSSGVGEPDAVAAANEVLTRFPDYFSAAWRTEISRALGFRKDEASPHGTADDTAQSTSQQDLINEFLAQVEQASADHLTVLRQLARLLLTGAEPTEPSCLSPDWVQRWRAENPDPQLMLATNPVRIPRNHLVEDALSAAASGDLSPTHALLAAITDPFDTPERVCRGVDTEEDLRYSSPAPETFGPYTTYCGT